MGHYGRLILTTPGDHKQEFNLTGKKVTIGRAPTSEIQLQDAKASRTHAQLELTEAGYILQDLNSTNGTRVNGRKIDRVELVAGDVIAIGACALRYEVDAPLEPTIIEHINSEAELEATLAESSLSMTLSDTSVTRLVVNTAEETWEVPFTQEAISVGRHPDNDIVLDHPKVSRNHARFERSGDRFLVKDLQSRNGTWLGSKRIEELVLNSSDTIRIGDSQLVFKGGFEPEELTIVETLRSRKKTGRRPVVFVPGLMGSELWQGSEKIWPNVRVLFKRPEILSLPEFRPLKPGQIVREVVIVPNLIKMDAYNLLGEYFIEGLGYEREVDFIEYAYDWRQDVRESAKGLANLIDNWQVAPPVTIIGHSLGTLVSRYYVEKLGGKDKVGRIILLGGPHSGAPHALTSLVYATDILPFGLLGERLRQVLATFPSTYQILPTYQCVYDQAGHPVEIMREDTWLPEEQRPLLRMGYEFRRELGTQSSVPTVSVFGYGLKTVTRINVQRTSQGEWQNMDFVSDSKGDDKVPQGSAIIEGSDLHPVQQHHGKLFIDNDVKMRLKLELTR